MSRIIYLHGFASGPTSEKAKFFAQRFAAMNIPVEIPDLNEDDFENLTISRQMKALEQVCRNEPVRLIGSSMGGYLASLYAARHPEVERLVLLAPAFSFITRWPEALGEEKFNEWRTTGFLAVPHYGEGVNSRVRFQLVEDARFYEDYPNFQQPALIFHGKNDTVVPPGYSITFSQQHANTKLRLLDSDHQLLDVLDEIWEEAAPFLQG